MIVVELHSSRDERHFPENNPDAWLSLSVTVRRKLGTTESYNPRTGTFFKLARVFPALCSREFPHGRDEKETLLHGETVSCNPTSPKTDLKCIVPNSAHIISCENSVCTHTGESLSNLHTCFSISVRCYSYRCA